MEVWLLKFLILVYILVLFEASAEEQPQEIPDAAIITGEVTFNLQNVQTLSNYYSNKSLELIKQFSSNYSKDYNCVAQKLKLQKYGSEIITNAEGYVLTLSAINQCYGKQSNEFFSKYANFLEKKLTKNFPLEDLDCVKIRLKKLKLDSKLVADFESDKISKQRRNYCRSIFQQDSLLDLNNDLRNLQEYLCNDFTEEISEIVDFSLAIIHFEKDMKLSQSEFDNIVNLFAKLFNFTVECVWPDLKFDEEIIFDDGVIVT
ncbi:unnamed protein product [Chironomus riparius]|uniref:Uncharacterized protein n=1 Tax=Chironomus riparius TaxID=315576 RepID=A0A9N9WTS5_9DIPT|nr:unnamed protein product [Chironomus riparius]